MNTIEKAIQEFKEKRLTVYRADSEQIVRDTRAAERATKDHAGRWLFELLQNSEDAEAPGVRVMMKDGVVYVADNGLGLKPDAVSAICGTDFSDKTSGTIGRKGVGFKSIYEVSSNPQVLIVNGGGIEFSQDKTKSWLKQNGFDDGYIPYQWIPFFVSWDEIRRQDPVLVSLANYKTIVRLPIISTVQEQKIQQLIKDWPPHALFAFRHLRQINAPDMEITLTPGGNIWLLRDSRAESPTSWLVSTHSDHPRDELLEPLGKDEQRNIRKDGVSFLLAAPLTEDCITPTKVYLPIHVFYPTEQKGPVRMLLHAEFLVKSDRTALLPIDNTPFNAWVAERLAYFVSKFVNDAYRIEKPSAHAALLVPFEDRASHPVAEDLWHRISDKAKVDLRLADAEGVQRLTVNETRMISIGIRSDLARKLLESTDIRENLLHSSFDEDRTACKALRELGCQEIKDEDLIEAIANNALSRANDFQWIWACWEWLAAWVGKAPDGETHRKRAERVMELPLVPVDGDLLKPSELADHIVTWKLDNQVGNLPGWLPLTFIEDWFRDKIQTVTEQKHSVLDLCKELGIQEPGKDVVQRAVGQAIDKYWKNQSGDPKRFLRFILEQEWYETSEAPLYLQRCPVQVQNETWAEAKKAYFGSEWGNSLLADLYEGNHHVAWVQNSEEDAGNKCKALEWLGCKYVPRIIEERGPHDNGFDTDELPEESRHWQRRCFGNTDGRRPTVHCIHRLEYLSIKNLNDKQVHALFSLLVKCWGNYYQRYSQTTLSWFYYTNQSRSISSFWWDEFLHNTRPTMKNCLTSCALRDCWLPDKRTQQAIGDLLPVLDLTPFEDDKDTVRNWFINVAGIRTRIEQMTIEEWKELLFTYIPGMTSTEDIASHVQLRDKVTGWYAACLETIGEQENVSGKVLALCPLLCQKGASWLFVPKEQRYLDDDNDLAKVFAGDVWLFHIPSRLTDDAVKYFGAQPLSESVQVDIVPGEPISSLPDRLLMRFNESLPYIWTWRSSQSKQAADRLSSRLKGLKITIVPTLKANLELNGVHHEVERRWHTENDTLFLHTDHANETELAQALAKALEIRSEADFYENLFRCNNPQQRKEKLLSKGIPDAEVERSLREYSDPSKEVAWPTKNPTKPTGTTSTPPQPPTTEVKKPLQKPDGDESKESSNERKRLFLLKDPQSANYIIGNAPISRGSGGGTSGPSDRETHLLTEEEKVRLEMTGRDIAIRELKERGYSVEPMTLNHPGFDLRGTKDGEELRVEVKAHTGRATVVDVTQRQYKEYLGQRGYRWELWNVEHLTAQDLQPITITQYENIPDDALDARTFRLDLKKCHSLENPVP